jgi:amidophosphoribosyltransferase
MNEALPILDDKLREECGLMGIWGHPEASNLTYLGLYAQQHRGQEGAGVVSLNRASKEISQHRGLGLVADIFGTFDFSKLPGDAAIGHVRYTTAGGNILANVQPFYAHIAPGKAAVAHNGNLVNTDALKKELIKDGAIFSATSDTEVILHLLARKCNPHKPLIETVIGALLQLRGAYSLLLLFEDRMIAARDPNGFRPLCIGDLNGAVVVASETCAFDLVGATYIRDVQPGEIVEISSAGQIKSYYPFPPAKPSPCVFEYVYFARPDSKIYGKNVYAVRKAMGHELAKEQPVEADIVIPVPDSGVTAAIGYSEESGIPFEMGLIRNHYVGRTFIEPQQSIRDFGVKIKLNANPEVLKDKRVIVIDDSIVRGTTSRKLVQMLRSAGAKEVHMRISAPPITDPCYYGIDTPEKDLLIASHKSVIEIATYLGVDTLAYLSLDGLYRAVGSVRGKFCDACFSGKYPVGTPDEYENKQGELFS